jgi:hypothetical protein
MTTPSLAALAADKLAVFDALYRFAAGIGLRDNDLLASSLAENAASDFRRAALPKKQSGSLLQHAAAWILGSAV